MFSLKNLARKGLKQGVMNIEWWQCFFALLFQHMTSSGHESMGSFPSLHSLAKASPATSFIAETFTTTEQVTSQSFYSIR